jgi:glyceraldehyde-3-phosphate dehydrogenase (NADP+)
MTEGARTPPPAPKSAAEGHPILVGGRWETSDRILESRTWDGREIGSTFLTTRDQYDAAVAAAVTAFATTRRLASFERGDLLRRVSAGITDATDELAHLLALEAGKPIADSRTEVSRTALAFRMAGEEAERIGGEVLPLDLIETARGRWGIIRRMPLGPVAAITPFNVPLSLAAHKLAPALAAGNTIVLKPPSKVPLTLLSLARIIDDAGAVPGSVSMLPMDREVGSLMVGDDRFRLLTFTGSAEVGWRMRAEAGTKRVTLELGGNAAVIIDESADVDRAVQRVVKGGFKYAGQLCISVQRCLVHASLWDEFVPRLVEGATALRVGDPLDESSDIGPMISERAAATFVEWVDEARQDGAEVLCGGTHEGAFAAPTVVTGVPRQARLCTEEAFAPVVVVERFDDFGEALAEVDRSKYGLQAGVFTRDLPRAWMAFEDLDVGAVVVNDVPTFRVDNMPYGGAKQSGLGREGIKYAIEHMTELRMLAYVP